MHKINLHRHHTHMLCLIIAVLGSAKFCIGLLSMSTETLFSKAEFYGITGRALGSNDSYLIKEVTRKCECHQLCLEDSCSAYSISKSASYGGPYICSLSNASVFRNRPNPQNGALYHVRKAHVLDQPAATPGDQPAAQPTAKPADQPRPDIFLGEDNLLYIRLGTKVPDFLGAKSACSEVPGFNLVSVRFEAQIKILLEICLGRRPDKFDSCMDQNQWFYVDMRKFGKDIRIRDEILVVDTDIKSYVVDSNSENFRFAVNKLHDERSDFESYPVCQANVFNVNY